ncbi:hypothetical protein L873DRAFT_1816661 [Choiromyces venosus 120613-1]|uniref:Uncharacterized protein n=1 Tax=Choiromyces venosus 120613-1 TaxID=1336337 RepID=A0A3N4J420_9PEZI|nr:hypothetical protein L873DRAFT_1816661 [Choiromyces venosus 120613-1]
MGVGICIQTSIEEIGREVSLESTALPRTLTDINYIQSPEGTKKPDISNCHELEQCLIRFTYSLLQHSASQRSAIVSCLSRG